MAVTSTEKNISIVVNLYLNFLLKILALDLKAFYFYILRAWSCWPTFISCVWNIQAPIFIRSCCLSSNIALCHTLCKLVGNLHRKKSTLTLDVWDICLPVKLDEDHKTTAFNMFNWELKQRQRHQQVAKQQLCRNCARASRLFYISLSLLHDPDVRHSKFHALLRRRAQDFHFLFFLKLKYSL